MDISTISSADISLHRDEDGVWCASAIVGPGRGATGDGSTPGEALGDLGEALDFLLLALALDKKGS